MPSDLLDMSSQPLCDPITCKWCEARFLLLLPAGPVSLPQSLSHSDPLHPPNPPCPSCTSLLHPMLPPTPTIITEVATFSPLPNHPSLHCQINVLETLSSPDQNHQGPLLPSVLELVGLSCPATLLPPQPPQILLSGQTCRLCISVYPPACLEHPPPLSQPKLQSAPLRSTGFESVSTTY